MSSRTDQRRLRSALSKKSRYSRQKADSSSGGPGECIGCVIQRPQRKAGGGRAFGPPSGRPADVGMLSEPERWASEKLDAHDTPPGRCSDGAAGLLLARSGVVAPTSGERASAKKVMRI